MRRSTPAICLAALAALASAQARPSEAGWLDLEGRIQYGFYTEDRRAIRSIADALGTPAPDDALRGYYAALAQYRIALLAAASDRAQAREAAERCATGLERTLRRHPDFAEGLALQAACLASRAALGAWRAPLAGSRGNAQLQRALQLAPRNPRVLLLDALGDFQRPRREAGDSARVLAKLKAAVAAFEAERIGAGAAPGWGAAEAYTLLARSHLERGEALEARSALERALLIAPEYAEARRVLSRIISGRGERDSRLLLAGCEAAARPVSLIEAHEPRSTSR